MPGSTLNPVHGEPSNQRLVSWGWRGGGLESGLSLRMALHIAVSMAIHCPPRARYGARRAPTSRAGVARSMQCRARPINCPFLHHAVLRGMHGGISMGSRCQLGAISVRSRGDHGDLPPAVQSHTSMTCHVYAISAVSRITACIPIYPIPLRPPTPSPPLPVPPVPLQNVLFSFLYPLFSTKCSFSSGTLEQAK